MKKEEILKHVDHTLLKAVATWEDIQKLCDEAILHNTASVCVPPCYVERIREKYGDTLNICTVIGFPLGYNATEIKVAEAEKAIKDGASEIDVVINLTDVKNNKTDNVAQELKALRMAAKGKVLKVIIETCYLTEEEKVKLCELVTESGADYIKTSTGFGTGGATISDIRLFKENIGGNVKMKASGGIKTKEDMENYLEAGCDRLGTSSAISILSGVIGDDY